ncbi:SDR family NAD(P)-dependent oxidoreductase [Algimonas porphyrae]|uniref:Dehydrogenase n=1 Tax=Algimonas porphyrae TaxID=1128113 RepID=A0ABQ5V053_9PROT|nr:SDR family oxidoreductase [Algimonas porphyrae]GLQ20342.1 dehydrogenase [Algimonas porphyrae]
MFDNQVVAVTGASGGIGRAIGAMFAQNGGKVALSDLSPPVEAAAGINAKAYACDVSSELSVKAFIEQVEGDLGPIDVFISNAGVGAGNGPHVAGGSNESWETSWQVNVMGSVYAARALMPGWLERGSGRFVVTASAAGLLNQVGSASYSATKHAAVSFAESIAIEHGDQGIKSHCICPQYVRTNMTAGVDFSGQREKLLEPEDVAETLRQAIRDEKFLVLPHPVAGEYYAYRAANPDGWLDGMRKMLAKLKETKSYIFKDS